MGCFLNWLGVRPECLHNRRRAARARTREWCTDGVAASSTAPGIFGPILAVRGEIETHGRGSLHPHILVWLLGVPLYIILQLLHSDPARLQTRLRDFMRATVAAMESTVQSSIECLPRRFGDVNTELKPPGFNKAERGLSLFDGGSELDYLRAKENKTEAD